MSIEVRGLNKSFGAFKAVDNVSFTVPTGGLLALLGPSGSGKSTLLRLIAGLETPDSGEVVLTGTDSKGLGARDRNVGFVFQHYALFKHMTVRQNIAFGLKVRGASASETRQRTEELLSLVQMEGYGDRSPSQLSGGQRQRVAVARALAPRPRVLLLDEPFGALDAKVKSDLRGWIRRLNGESGITTVLVTHDQEEAMEVAGKIIILDQGRVEQEGDPRAVFDRPATQFVADFVGETNSIEAVAEEDGLAVWGPLRFSVGRVRKGSRVRIYFRPHDVYVTREKESLQVPALIARECFKGAFTELDLDLGGGRRVWAHLPRGLSEASGFAPGERVYAGITGFHVFTLA